MKKVSIIIIFLAVSVFVYAQKEDVSGMKGTLKEQAQDYRQQGYLRQTGGDLKGALAFYKKASELDPEDYEIYNDMGVVYEALGMDEDALFMYEKAVQMNTGYLPAYTNLALYYEKKGDLRKAVHYWSQRYRFGKKGEYWREKARQKVLAMASYPELREEVLETEAMILSKELAHTKAFEREEKEKKDIREARMRFQVALQLFDKENYTEALKELESALYLNPQDEELKVLLSDLYVMAKRAYAKKRIKHYTDEAMMSVDSDDYLTASKKMMEAQSAVSDFSKK